MTSLPTIVREVVDAAQSRKAEDLVVLDLRGSDAFTDFFVIASGRNPRQIRATADVIEERLAQLDRHPTHVEGRDSARWILMDYFDIVVHVFSEDRRAFYGLERLWGSARRIDVSPQDAP